MTDTTIEVVENTEVEIKETFMDKIKDGIKKYGKKIAAVAAVAIGAGLTGYAIGHMSDSDDEDDAYELLTDGEVTDETTDEA